MDLIPPISNANGIANISNNANGIPKIGIGGPSIIPTIDPPVVRSTEVPVVRGLALPVFQAPDTSIKYPVINVPTQEEFDAAARADKQKEQEQKEEKSRGLPDPKPVDLPPSIQQVIPQPTTPQIEVPTEPITPAFTVAGLLHYVMAESGHIDVFEYSDTGTKLVDQVENVEQYIRDQVEINALYEIDNKIIIDDVIADKFTKEGQKRFKPLFAPAKKIAKKLSAKFSI